MNEPLLSESTEARRPIMAGIRLQPALISIALAVLTVSLFLPLRNADYITVDDPNYVTSNPYVRLGLTPKSIVWAFTTRQASNWHPLTWISHMIDRDVFGLGPAGPHMVNVVLHTANSVLVFLVMLSLTGATWRSAMVAGLFGWHPLHVESVAWIAERKDVLSTFFGLLAIGAYARWAKARQSNALSPASKVMTDEGSRNGVGRGWATLDFGPWTLDYLLALGFFVLGLLAKSMLVTLPLVLILLDYWPIQRKTAAWKLVVEKWPFLLLSAVFCVMTLWAQSSAIVPVSTFPIVDRIENAFVSYARYVVKMFWPMWLAFPYPPAGKWPLGVVAASLAFVAGTSVVAVLGRRRLPFVATGWFWFLGTLVPVIGLVQVGSQAMADRYSYVPLIGLFIVVSWGAEAVFRVYHVPTAAQAATAAIALAACGVRTVQQLQFWQDSGTLFHHTIAICGEVAVTLRNLGIYEAGRHRPAAAMELYQRALELEPSDVVARADLGLCLYNQGRIDDAITNYQEVLRMAPHDPRTWNKLGLAYVAKRNLDAAVICYQKALQFWPDYPDAHNNLGVILNDRGKSEEAIHHFHRALVLAPDNAEAHNNLGNVFVVQNKFGEAAGEYRKALSIDPEFTQAMNNLGWVLANTAHYGEAILLFQQALRARPGDALIHRNLASTLAAMNRLEQAVAEYRESVRLGPNDPFAQCGLASVLARTGQRGEAQAHAQEALRLMPNYPEARQLLQSLARP